MIPTRYTVADILPSQGGRMARDGYQECRIRKTAGKNPKWYCKYAVQVLTGPGQTRRVERRKYFGACSEVGKRKAELERDAFRDTVNSAHTQGGRESQIPLANWIRTYDATFIASLKPNTQISYRAYCGLIERHFGAVRLCDVTVDKIQQWINALAADRTKRTLEYILAVFHSLLEVASDYGYSEARNPCDKVRLPSGVRSTVDRRALQPDEIRRLLSVADTVFVDDVRLGDIARLGLFCGLRVGEILALEWGDVRGRELHITKSRSQRTGETTEPKSEAGRRVVALGPVILARPASATDRTRIFPLDYWNIRRPMKRALDASGIKLEGTSFHALRRTYATMRRRIGGGSLREAMGHAKESMSMLYVRESFADDESAAMSMASLVMGDGTKQ